MGEAQELGVRGQDAVRLETQGPGASQGQVNVN